MKPIITIKSTVLALLLFITVALQAQTQHKAFSITQPPQLQADFTIDTALLPTVTLTATSTIGKYYWIFDDGDFVILKLPLINTAKMVFTGCH